MFRFFSFAILILMVFSSCKSKENQKVTILNKNDIIIELQPFDGITAAQINYLFNELKKIYSSVEIKQSIPLPKVAYYAARNRYRADSIINILSNNIIAEHKIIAITNKDISTTKNNFADWGVMGLGFCPGKACVISTFRLAKNDINNQLFKVAIHELGHTFGLPHCPIKSCFMRDAEGTNTTNEEKEFCSNCRSFLLKHGWNLK